MSDIADRLSFLMKQAKELKSVADAARAYGIGYEVFKKIANPKASDPRNLTPEQALKIAHYHKVSPGWLLFNEGHPQRAGIPLLGKISGGQTMKTFEDPGNEEPIPVDILGVETAGAFLVEGDSMWPLARDGDIVFVGEPRQDIKSLIGVECAVVLEDGRRLFKVIENGARAGRYDLVSHNAETIRDVEIHSAGPLIAVKRRGVPRRSRKRAS